jgi:hypothetical protein
MPTTDNSYAVQTARRRQQTLSAFHRAFPTRPEQGPRGGVTDSSTYLARRLGDTAVRFQTVGGSILEACCGGAGGGGGGGGGINVPRNFYITGFYASNPFTLYDASNTAVITLPNSGSNDAFMAMYDSSGNVKWGARMSSDGFDRGIGIAADVSGYSYVTGNFSSTATIYNADGSPFSPTLTSLGINDAFVLKYDISGTCLWAAQIGSTADDNGRAIAVDKDKNVYVTGFYTGTPTTIFNADGTTTIPTLTCAGDPDMFCVKYTTQGVAQWAAHMSGSQLEDGIGIAVDANGNVFITGRYRSSPVTIYNSDNSVFGTLDTSGGFDVFVVKYNNAGFAQWAAHMSGTDADIGNSISVDANGNCYVTGQYSSTPLTIYNADGVTTTTLPFSGGTADAFLVQYNSSGVVAWATRIANTRVDAGKGVSIDKAGNIYITGTYGDPVSSFSTIVYNADSSVFKTLTGAGSVDTFIVKYNTNGFAQWATRMAGVDSEESTSIASDVSGNICVTGYYSGNMTIYNEDDTPFGTLIPVSGLDIFIVTYDTNGFALWAAKCVGAATDIGLGVGSSYFLGV